jgi:hypothetical protein
MLLNVIQIIVDERACGTCTVLIRGFCDNATSQTQGHVWVNYPHLYALGCGTIQARLWTRFEDPRAKACACCPKNMSCHVLVLKDPFGVDEIQQIPERFELWIKYG